MAQPKLSVLVVEDNPLDREAFRRYLQQSANFDYVILEAEQGEAGLRLCQEAQPDAVLVDYILPDLSGIEFLTHVKAAMGANAPPLIVVTGQGNETIAVQTLKAGAEDYLIKGQLGPSSLQHSIEQAVAKTSLQKQLQQSETRFSRAIAEAPFPIFIHGEDGVILQMSHTISDLTGYTACEIQTIRDWAERAYGDKQQNVLANISRLYAANQRIDEGEFEIRTKSGENRTWLFSSAPLGQLDNGTRLVISMAADVTEQKQTEAALTARLKQQAALAHLSQVALSGVSLEFLFEQTTQLVADSLDLQYSRVLELLTDARLLLRSAAGGPSELVGQFTIETDADSQAGYTLTMQQPIVFSDLQTETRFHGTSLLRDYGVVSGMSVIIPSHSNRPFGILAAHSTRRRDFTQDDINFLQAVANVLATAIDRKRIERELHQLNLTLEQRVQSRTEALEEANQELEAFSYSVAHDLRAPLRAIQGFAQFLKEDYSAALDDLGTEYVRRMASSSEHLDTLIQDLLAYSRLGRADMHLQRTSIAVVVQELLVELESWVQTKQATVEVASDLPLVLAQRNVLKQVLNNLLSNALKFVSPDVLPQIKIWAEVIAQSDHAAERSPQVRIWITDNGIGIAPQHQERIFNPFERLHGIDTYPGTGIGLSIVARGARRMGGRAGVESSLDQGSQFWIELASA